MPKLLIIGGGIAAIAGAVIVGVILLSNGNGEEVCCEPIVTRTTSVTADPTSSVTANPTSSAPTLPPSVIAIDDPQLLGPAENWTAAAGGFEGDFSYTLNNGPCDFPDICPAEQDVNWAEWRPNLTPGEYRVCVWIPPWTNLIPFKPLTKAAQYRVFLDDSNTRPVVVDQAAASRGWADIGVFDFSSSGYLYLGDWTGEAWQSNSRVTATAIVVDVARWVPGGGSCGE